MNQDLYPPELRRTMDLASEATDKARKVRDKVEAADPRDPDLVRAARDALALAESIEWWAYENAAEAQVDTPGVRNLLEVLKEGNKKLAVVVADLKKSLDSLKDFIKVAKGITGILKAFSA